RGGPVEIVPDRSWCDGVRAHRPTIDAGRRSTVPALLYLIRHARTAHNALDEVHGLLDDPLDERGLAEADALGRLFTGVALRAVYASPLQRAVQTATPLARAAGLDVIEVHEVLDRDYGPWTGHLKRTVIAEFGSVDAAPGVEPWAPFTAPVTPAFDT